MHGYLLRPQDTHPGDSEVSADQWPVSLDRSQHSANRHRTETIRVDHRPDEGDLLVHSFGQFRAIARSDN